MSAHPIVLVRHGEPTSYRDGGLTPHGRRQALRAGRELSEVLSPGPVAVWTSPARRCRDTARLVAARLRAGGHAVGRLRYAPELANIAVELEGRAVDIGLARDRAAGPASRELCEFWEDHRRGRNPFEAWEAGAYPSLDSPGAVRARVAGFLTHLDGCNVLVTHSEVIRLIGRLARDERAETVPWGGVLVLDGVAGLLRTAGGGG